ncbi:hypothetical protein Tco_0462026 [Tanacetum coccineum]
MAVDAGESSHPPKKLREDHGTPSGASVGGKSRSSLQRLLAGAVLNAEVRGEVVPTFPFVTSSVSTTPEREGEDHTDSVTGHNLRTIGAPQRFVISSDSSHHFGANVAEAEVDSLIRSSIPVMTTVTTTTPTADPAVVVKEKISKPSLFAADSSSTGGADPVAGIFLDLTRSDFLVSGVRTVIDPDTDLQKVYVPQWSMTNGSYLDDGRVCHEMVDEFAPPKFFASVRGMEHDQLFTEFNVRAVHQISLSAEVRMCAEYNIKEKRRLKSAVDEKNELLKVREGEIENLKAQLLLKEAEAAEAIRLRAEASKFEAIEKSLQDEVKVLKEHNATLEKEKTDPGVKVANLTASLKVREQEVADLDTQVTFVKSQSDSLADRVHELETSFTGLQEKVIVYENCIDQIEKFQDDRLKKVNDKFDKLYANFVEMSLHLEERLYPHILTTIFGRRWLLTHDIELAITKCINSPEYLSALGAAIGKAIEKGMQDGLSVGITHGKEGRVLTDVAAYNPSAEADYVSALQQLQHVNLSLLAELRSNKDAGVEVLMNILRLEDALDEKLGLSELQPHVDQLMVPIHHSPNKTVIALHDVFVPLAEPLFAVALEGTEDDYEFVNADGPKGAGANADPFPNVDDVDLNISSASAALSMGMPILAGKTASIPYVNENGVSPLLDFIMVRCAHRTCESSSNQFLFFAPNLAFIPSPRLRFALSTRPLVCGYDLSWEPESIDNVIPHKYFDLVVSDGCNRFCFNPLCEVVNVYYQEFDFPRSFQKGSGYVDSPLIEQQWRRD